jgi:hypothetical protein
MEIVYKSPFKKFVKKQSRAFQLAIEDATDDIKAAPAVGEEKKGDLSGFMVYKFDFHKQEYLIAYKLQSNRIVCYMIDTHENFYRNLKRYVKEAE